MVTSLTEMLEPGSNNQSNDSEKKTPFLMTTICSTNHLKR